MQTTKRQSCRIMKLAATKNYAVYTGKSLVYEDFCVAVNGKLTESQKTALFQVVAILVNTFEKEQTPNQEQIDKINEILCQSDTYRLTT